MNTESSTLLAGYTRSYTKDTTVTSTLPRQELKQIERKKKCAKTLMGIIIIVVLCLIGLLAFGMDKIQKSFSNNKQTHNKANKNNQETSYQNTEYTDTTTTPSSSSISPNIIFIVMDDMGYSDISARGAEFNTPNLDLLYENSIEIKNHYIGLVCSPSRSQMITGRYAFNMGISEQVAFGAVQINALATGIPTIGDLLHEYTNYHTYWTGKWHLGVATDYHTPLQRGFEKFYGFLTSNIDYNDKTVSSTYYPGNYIDWRAMEDVDYDTQYDYSTWVTQDYALEIIDSHVSTYGTDTPFYLQLPFQAIHQTLVNIDSENSATCDSISDDSRKLVCQSILAIDQVIGNLINNLKNKNNIYDNTLIIFTSDNGGAYSMGSCNSPLRGGKEKYFEGGIKTLAFMSGGYIDNIKNDNTKSLTIRDEPMHGADWVPTLLTIAGVDVSQVEQDLQDKLYKPVAKKVSESVYGTDKYYENYLMQESFDGNDVSQWLLYGSEKGGINDRSDVPLSINNIEDDENRDYDVAIVFTSKYTGNKYKFMYLVDELGCKKKNTEICTFGADDGDNNSGIDTKELIDDDSGMTDKIINSETSDSDDEKTILSIDDVKNTLAEKENEMNEKRYVLYSLFTKTDMFLFDLNIEPNELTNLMEIYLDDFETIEVEDSVEKMYRNMEMNDVDDYDENLVSLIWNEGLNKVQEYMDNSVMANDYLNCAYSRIDDDADPSKFGNAWGPFYTWDQYIKKFDQLCSKHVNPVLKELFQTKFNDYYIAIDETSSNKRIFNY